MFGWMTNFRSLLRGQLTSVVGGLLVCSLSLLLLRQYLHLSELNEETRVRARVTSQLSTLRARLELALYSRLYLQRAVISNVSSHPDITQEEYVRLAADVVGDTEGLVNVTLAKDNVISHVYPYRPNASALGLNLFMHDQQRTAVRRMMERRKTVLTGPVDLVQGGKGIISRDPIYLPPTTDGRRTYWGLASVVIDYEALLREAGFHEPHGLQVAGCTVRTWAKWRRESDHSRSL